MSARDKPDQDQVPEDETKRKFREALAAKQGRKGEDHIDNAPQHGQAHGPVDAKRTTLPAQDGLVPSSLSATQAAAVPSPSRVKPANGSWLVGSSSSPLVCWISSRTPARGVP